MLQIYANTQFQDSRLDVDGTYAVGISRFLRYWCSPRHCCRILHSFCWASTTFFFFMSKLQLFWREPDEHYHSMFFFFKHHAAQANHTEIQRILRGVLKQTFHGTAFIWTNPQCTFIVKICYFSQYNMYDNKLLCNYGRQIARVCPVWMVNVAFAVKCLHKGTRLHYNYNVVYLEQQHKDTWSGDKVQTKYPCSENNKPSAHKSAV